MTGGKQDQPDIQAGKTLCRSRRHPADKSFRRTVFPPERGVGDRCDRGTLKKYGEGVVTQLDDRLVHIMFQDDTLRMMDLKNPGKCRIIKSKEIESDQEMKEDLTENPQKGELNFGGKI